MNGTKPQETFQLLIETGGIDRTNTLLCAACAAFARRDKPLPAEIEQFTALVRRLFPAAQPRARAAAAATLSRAAALSPELESLVAAHSGEGMEEFLERANTLSQATMLDVIGAGDVAASAAIARRHDLTTPVLSALLQINSRAIYRALAANTSITPRGAHLGALARSAQVDHEVAVSLAAREDFDTALLAPAFFDLAEDDRLRIISAFAQRNTPHAPIKKTLEQLSVATDELTRALTKLFAEDRRPEVSRLMHQITGLDEARCNQIAHDGSGAALFVVVRAFGCDVYDGLKVMVHAAPHDVDGSRLLGTFAKLFETVSTDAAAYLLSVWRGEVNLLELARPEYLPFQPESRRTPAATGTERRSDSESAVPERAGAQNAG